MNRVSALTLVLFAPLLLTQHASAQDCFCGLAPTFGMDGAAETDAGALEADPPETPDTTILSSVVFIAELAPVHGPVPAAPAVLWCTSGNDPRCMPMHASDAPELRALEGGPVAVTIDAERLRVRRVARDLSVVTPAEDFPAATGVQRSLDRPPRS